MQQAWARPRGGGGWGPGGARRGAPGHANRRRRRGPDGLDLWLAAWVFCLAGAAAWAWPDLTRDRGWTAAETARHLAARPNCAAARAVGLAPAGRGRPGYWTDHDRDRDGVACEVWRG